MIRFLMSLFFGKKDKCCNEKITLYRDVHQHAHWSVIIKTQSEKIQQLEEALEPFAQQGRILDLNESGSVPDVWHFKLNDSISAITVGDCKKAKEVLKSC